MAPKKKAIAAEGGADSSSGRVGKRKPTEHEHTGRSKRVSRKRDDDDFASMEDTDGMEDEEQDHEEVQQQHEQHQQHFEQQEQQEHHHEHQQQEHVQQQQDMLLQQQQEQQQQQQDGGVEGMSALTQQQGDENTLAMQQALQAQMQQQHALTLHAHAALLHQQQQAQQQHLMQAVQMPTNTASDVARTQLDSLKKADMDQIARAKRAGNVATITLVLDLPMELQTQETAGRGGMIEVPTTGDVQMLKRLLMYSTNMQLVPTLQQLFTEALDGTGQLVNMADEHIDEEGKKTPMPLSVYGIKDGSTVTLKVVIPDDPQAIPVVDEAVASAAYTANANAAPNRTPSRKQRWTMEQIDALVEGVEKNGLSAWRAIVSDPRLVGKNNMQCKDKFRNLCLTIIQGRPERGLTLSWPLKERLRAFIEREHIVF